MRIGIFMGSVRSSEDLAGQVQQVVDAENDGFDSFWATQVSGFDSLTLLALAGQRTNRIHMGTAVVPTFPRHPVMLAQQALTANAATNGRLNLGVGLSHKPTVEDRWGIPFKSPALHMEEYLTVLQTLITDGEIEFRGKLFNIKTSIQVPRTLSFPILIAALAPKMLRIAGELSAGTITWMVGPKTLKSHIQPRISAAAQAAGRPDPRICAGYPIAVTDDQAKGRQQARELFSRYSQLPSYRRMLDIEGVTNPAELAIVGNECEVTNQISAIACAGATEFLASIFPVGDDEEASIFRTRSLLRELVGKI